MTLKVDPTRILSPEARRERQRQIERRRDFLIWVAVIAIAVLCVWLGTR